MERTQFIRILLFITVFVTGAAVLILEVTAVRVLAPFYGSSIYVLSSVLTIILAALSFGYYVGGKLSDRFASHEPLFAIITLSGLTVLGLQFLSQVMLPLGALLFSVMTGPLVFGFLFFFLPAFLLGIDSPYVIKIQSRYATPETTGAVVGATFFWGTVGSIVGSISTGFVLIPALGVHNTMLSVGCVLVALGIMVGTTISVLVAPQGQTTLSVELVKKRFFILTVLVLACGLLALNLRYDPHAVLNVVYKKDAVYSSIIVHDIPYKQGSLRMLKNDLNQSSATLFDSYDLVFAYSQFAEFYPELKPDTTKYLLIGGGAYSIPRTLVARDPNLQVDVVEIEPVLYEIAKEYFDLSDTSRITNYPIDGRVFFREYDTKYDVIFGDAFNTDHNVPTHLATREFFQSAHDHLNDDGVFMLNYIGTLKKDAPSLTGSFVRTIQSVFPNVQVYAFEPSRPEMLQNIMFVATKSDAPFTLNQERVIRNLRKEWVLKDIRLEADYFDLEDELIFTDDKAPIEYLMFKQS